MAQTQLSSSPAAIEVDGGVESSHGIRFLARGDDEDTLGLAALRTLTQINRHAAWKTRSLLDLLVSEGSRLEAILIDSKQAWRVSNLATLSQKVRNRIGRYQGFVAKLGDRIEQSADRRIGLRASAETQRLRTTGAEIRLRFDPRAPEADELLRRLLLSDVETVFAEALRGDVAGPVTVVHRAALRDLLRKSNFTGDVGDAVLRFDSIRFDPDVLGHVFSLEHRTRDWIGYRRKAVTALAEKALLTMWAVYHSGPLRWPVERYSRCQLELGKAIEHWFDRSGEQAWTFGLRGEIQPLTLALLRTLLDLADPDPFTPGPFLSVDLELLDANGGVVKRLVVS